MIQDYFHKLFKMGIFIVFIYLYLITEIKLKPK